jgi:CelD/BcsL family acetyltransferase involved in cellulose biosynthesis
MSLVSKNAVPPHEVSRAAELATGIPSAHVTAERSSSLPATRSGTMNEFKVRIEKDFRVLENLREEWDRAVIDLGGTIYLSYDWSRTWWEFYGAGKDLRIFLFYAGEQIVGILPLYVDRVGFGPLKCSIARLVCANIPPKAFNPPIHPDWAEKIFQAVLTQLIERDGCDVLSFGPLSEEQTTAKALEAVARKETSLVSNVELLSEGVVSVFHLPNSLDDYFESLDKDERKKRKYELRLLRRERQTTEDVLSEPTRVEAEFDDFARQHAAQWVDKGKLGHFGSWPQALEFNRALVKSQGRLGRVRFIRILAGNETVSSQYAFVFGKSIYWELPARVIGQNWQRFSLGPAGFFALVDAATKEGVTRVEGGLAHYDYKQKLKAREFTVHVVRIVGRSTGSRWRARLFLGLRSALLVAYYKIWYARVSPRLPAAFRKPIWSFWLRLDF